MAVQMLCDRQFALVTKHDSSEYSSARFGLFIIIIVVELLTVSILQDCKTK